MAASTVGAVKAFIESLGYGIAVFGDRVPAATPRPYITIREGISTVPEAAFSQFDDAEGHVRELAQVDVWQERRAADGMKSEDRALGDRLALALHACRLAAAPFPVSGVVLVGKTRVPDPDDNVVHDAITIAVHRTLARSVP